MCSEAQKPSDVISLSGRAAEEFFEDYQDKIDVSFKPTEAPEQAQQQEDDEDDEDDDGGFV